MAPSKSRSKFYNYKSTLSITLIGLIKENTVYYLWKEEFQMEASSGSIN
jgi:hypothetical protein